MKPPTNIMPKPTKSSVGLNTPPPKPPSLISHQEIGRIAWHAAFWGLWAIIIGIAFGTNTITKDVNVPHSVAQYIEERLNIQVVMFEILTAIILLGGIAAFLSKFVNIKIAIKLASEEISRIFYTLGWFGGFTVFLLGYINSTPVSYLQGFLIAVGYSIFGYFVYLLGR